MVCILNIKQINMLLVNKLILSCASYEQLFKDNKIHCIITHFSASNFNYFLLLFFFFLKTDLEELALSQETLSSGFVTS